MAAAEALLAYEPLQQLQHENFLLREEARRAQSEVQELLAWKEKAVTHMAAMAPARRRAAREVERAKQLQQQLRTVESSLQTRGVLEQTATALESERERLQQRVTHLEQESATLKRQSEREKRRVDEAEAQLAAMGETFRLHLERLVAVRESLDDEDDKSNQDGKVQDESTTKAETQDVVCAGDDSSNVAKARDNNTPEISEEDGDDASSSAALVAGLDAVAAKCLAWLQEHLAQSFARQQLKAARYEEQHANIQRLREQVLAASRVPEQQAQTHARQTRELAELRESREQLQRRAEQAERTGLEQQRRREEMATRLRLVAGEVRQYLRLVRGEIKRKFGYLPEAIAHAESWARIAEALELLLRQGSERPVAVGS
ncbi:hypothetical protein BBJ28_00013810 [Nothophytophthora sp. Chile5]|nr:hypothetical protein BBJ28_00013810 [Nothophytophthora sp. Chile5]